MKRVAGVGAAVTFLLAAVIASIGGGVAAQSAAGCGTTPTITGTGTGNAGPVPVVHGKYTQQQISELWIAIGGPKDQAEIAGAVGMAESGGDPSIVNSIGASGLMQIHPPEPGVLDPETNMRIALRKWKGAGNSWQPWEAYTGPDGVGADGPYLQYMPGHKTPHGPGAPTATPETSPRNCAPAGGVGGTLKGRGTRVPWPGGAWPVSLPGFPGESCDPRIIPDVLLIVKRYHAFVSDCYGHYPHSSKGEHPMGLAVDLQPGKGGTWDDLDQLARDFGWRTACSASGCAGQTGSVMRFIGWDNYPNHGRGNHLHLSWDHGPGLPAQWVNVLNPPD